MIKLNKNDLFKVYGCHILEVNTGLTINVNFINPIVIQQDKTIIDLTTMPDDYVTSLKDGFWVSVPLMECNKIVLNQWGLIRSKSAPIVYLKGKYQNVSYPFDNIFQFDNYYFDLKLFKKVPKLLYCGVIFDTDNILFINKNNDVVARLQPVLIKG